jgi:6-phosphogluconolactonase
MRGTLQVFPTPGALAVGAAEFISITLARSLAVQPVTSLVLSGGGTPRSAFEVLAGETYQRRIDWKRVHVFWGDERCVPPTSAESNFHMAHQSLLRRVPIPAGHIHRIHGDIAPHEAAAAYEAEIRSVFSSPVPSFTLVLLGLGDDGHTASLFPASPVLNETRRLVADVPGEHLGTRRVTMTYPLLNNAQSILFLVSGASKAQIVSTVISGERQDLPASRIAPVSGALQWYADRDAVSSYAEASQS